MAPALYKKNGWKTRFCQKAQRLKTSIVSISNGRQSFNVKFILKKWCSDRVFFFNHHKYLHHMLVNVKQNLCSELHKILSFLTKNG